MRQNRGVKGVIVSTELILIIATILVLTFIVALGLGRSVVNQAVSTKATIVVNEATGWYYGPNAQLRNNPFITVSFYVTNLGDDDVTITNARVYASRAGSTACYYNAGINKVVKPGETIALTQKLNRITCSTSTVNILDSGILELTYRDVDNRVSTVQVPITLTKP